MIRGIVLFLTFIAFFLDWSSTIIQSPSAEENPFMRMVWERGGDIGFTLVTLLAMLIVMWLIVQLSKLRWWLVLLVLPLIVFKILIALTNYGLLPISVTGWFQF